MKSIYRAIVLALLLTFSVLGYQNCSESDAFKLSSKTTNDGTDNQGPLDDNGNVPEEEEQQTPKAFYAGDAFSINKIPYTLDSGSYQNIVDNYAGLANPKAIAVAANGMASAWGGASFSSQAEVNQAMLERCQLKTGNQACAIFAEGDLIKYDEDVFYNSLGYSIQPTTTFDASKVPGVNNNTKTNLAGNNYANRTNAFKAVAIGYVGNSNVGWSEVSQAEATRRAIERCEYVSDLPCNVFAEGNTVVFDFTTITWSPRLLTYGPVAYDTLKVPFVREQDRDGNFADIPGRVGNGQRVVAALHVAGYYFIGVDDNNLAAAEDTALTNCNNSVPATSSYNCFVYSRDLNVVMTHDTIVNSRKP